MKDKRIVERKTKLTKQEDKKLQAYIKKHKIPSVAKAIRDIMLKKILTIALLFCFLMPCWAGQKYLNVELPVILYEKKELPVILYEKETEFIYPAPYCQEYLEKYIFWFHCSKCNKNDNMFFKTGNDKEWICKNCDYIFTDKENDAINLKMHESIFDRHKLLPDIEEIYIPGW